MKKITFLFLSFSFFLSPFFVHAQSYQLPDSGFETGWVEEDGFNGKFWEYTTDFFYTLNSLYALPNDPLPADITAFRDPNAQSGNYCIKLVSGIIPIGETVVFLPGMVGTINKAFVEEFIGSEGEVTLTSDWNYDTPHSLEGWFKYKPVNGDSALINIGFSDFDEEVFVEKMIIKETVTDWTHFVIPIPEQYTNKDYNRIRVLFVASAGVNFDMLMFCKGQLGSTLCIDNIFLNYSNGIRQNLFSSLKASAYPNPATTEVINIETNENFTGKIMVYSILGGCVMEEKVDGVFTQLNISSLPAGNYIYKLMNENTIFAQGKFIVTK